MAENKSSFVIYTDWKQDFEFLTNEEAGKLIKHLLQYASDQNPTMENEDRLLQFAAQKMKSVMKKDLKKYEEVVRKRAEAGKKGGISSGESRGKKQSKANEASASKGEANERDNDNDNDNERVIDKKHPLLESNLFRKPEIPTKQNVLECFVRNGGTKEMALKFWNKHDSAGWFANGSPILKVDGLIANYVQTWKGNEKKKPNYQTERSTSAPAKRVN